MLIRHAICPMLEQAGFASLHDPPQSGPAYIMPKTLRLSAAFLALVGLAACDPGPNGKGSAPPGVSQDAYEAQVVANRNARNAYYRGPRGGASGR